MLENDQINLKQRLKRVNENMIMNSVNNRTSPERRKVDSSIAHWDGIGIVNSTTKLQNIVDTTKIHDGWKVASVEVRRDHDFVRSIENKLNAQLKNAALETKKYAEQVK